MTPKICKVPEWVIGVIVLAFALTAFLDMVSIWCFHNKSLFEIIKTNL